MHMGHAVLLFFAAVIAGGLNSVAGGGSFIGFPALLLTGIQPIHANATNTVALWPGSLASVGGYAGQLKGQKNPGLIPFVIISLVGGTAGALVLLHTPQSTFTRMIPWLMLAATLIFTFGNRITVALRRRRLADGPHHGRLSRPVVLALQFATAVYGGFFGAGIGILMLAILALMGMEQIHRMNAYKNLLATCINGVAVIAFVMARVVSWPQALLMIVGSVVGGYGTARFVQKIDPRKVRWFVIVVAFGMTGYFFYKYGL